MTKSTAPAGKAKRAPAGKVAAIKKPVAKKAPAKKAAATAKKKPAPAPKKAAAPVKAKAPAKKIIAKAPPPPAKKAAAPDKEKDKKVTKADIATKVAAAPAAKGKTVETAAAKATGKTAAPASTKAGAAQKPGASKMAIEPKVIEAAPAPVAPRPSGPLFSEDELSHFRKMLESERDKILTKARQTVEEGSMVVDRNEMLDEVDQASQMVEQNLTFRLLDRDRKLLTEIEHAIGKIETGDYGYCEGTGEAIPKRRLELRPWCRHSVKYKEKLERMEKSGRGVVDEDEIV